MATATAFNSQTLFIDKSTDLRDQRLALLLLIGLWILTRGLLFLLYSPLPADDTGAYQRLASQIANLDFHEYNGFRTPGYPLLILLALNNNYIIWIIQSLLGLSISILVFFIIRLHGVSVKWALAGAILQLLALNEMFFEAFILTETLTTFLVVLAFYLFVYSAIHKSHWYSLAAVGLVSALLVLTRPQYLFIIPLLALFVIIFFQSKRALLLLIFLIFSLPPVIGWMYFNKEKTGYFSISNGLGFNLTNHSGAFMEYAPDEYAIIRDIYLKYRKAKMAETGSHRMTIFLAWHELREVTGLPDPQIAHQFQRLSMQLFMQFPLQYMASVADAWLSFWVVPNYWHLDELKFQSLANSLKVIWKGQQVVYRLFNLLFLIAAVVLLWQLLRRRKLLQHNLIPLLLITIILGNSVVQATAEYGENGRYSIPIQPLVITVVILAIANLVNRKRDKITLGKQY
jgi:hypothetical protein